VRKNKGPEFIRFMTPIMDSLRELGGSGKASEVVDLVIQKAGITDTELDLITRTGVPRIKNQIHWARMYLVYANILDSSKRGVWSLTEKGFGTQLHSDVEVYELFRTVHKRFEATPGFKGSKRKTEQPVETEEDEKDIESSHHDRLIAILKSLPPAGFERLCQRLLREAGFKKVIVTGKSGDGGIDGEGILEVNPLMSFKVLFQSKRYDKSVSSSQVRDFRGAMQGRADKGIIITTGGFTQDAKKEAMRDGVPPIELVDGDALVDLFERCQLGLRQVTAYEIIDEFFEEYRGK
jgi:restriction system protein